MFLTARVRLAEDDCGSWSESLAEPVRAAITPFADLGDELEVAEKLVIDEVVVAPEVPEEVRPRGVCVEGELRRSRRPLDRPFEVRLEVLELGERLPA